MTSSWLLLGFRSVVKNSCFISSDKGVPKLFSFLCVACEKLQRGTNPFGLWSSVNILCSQRAHNFLYPHFSVTVSWILVLDSSGMMWCNSLHLAGRNFGSTLQFQTRLAQTKPVLPLWNEHGSQVEDQVWRQCCHNRHKKFPYTWCIFTFRKRLVNVFLDLLRRLQQDVLYLQNVIRVSRCKLTYSLI
jgi:hypothetical protein